MHPRRIFLFAQQSRKDEITEAEGQNMCSIQSQGFARNNRVPHSPGTMYTVSHCSYVRYHTAKYWGGVGRFSARGMD